MVWCFLQANHTGYAVPRVVRAKSDVSVIMVQLLPRYIFRIVSAVACVCHISNRKAMIRDVVQQEVCQFVLIVSRGCVYVFWIQSQVLCDGISYPEHIIVTIGLVSKYHYIINCAHNYFAQKSKYNWFKVHFVTSCTAYILKL